MLTGEKVYLRLMEERDIPYKVKWINNPEIRTTLNFDYPISELGTRKWLNTVSTNPSRKDFIIVHRVKNQPIGYTGLINIDTKSSKAEIYTGIGEKQFQGKGLAYESRIVLLRYAFFELSLNKVYAYNWVENDAIVHLNKKVGFKIEGTLKEDIFSHGELRDRYIMSIFKRDFLKKYPCSRDIY